MPAACLYGLQLHPAGVLEAPLTGKRPAEVVARYCCDDLEAHSIRVVGCAEERLLAFGERADLQQAVADTRPCLAHVPGVSGLLERGRRHHLKLQVCRRVARVEGPASARLTEARPQDGVTRVCAGCGLDG